MKKLIFGLCFTLLLISLGFHTIKAEEIEGCKVKAQNQSVCNEELIPEGCYYNIEEENLICPADFLGDGCVGCDTK